MAESKHEKVEIYQKAVMQHSRQPQHYEMMDDPDYIGRGRNRLCGDTVNLYLRLSANGERIDAASFDGESCAICRASASMLCGALHGRSLVEATALIECLEDFTSSWQCDERIGEFQAMQVLSAYPTRLKCLRLPWHAAREALQHGANGDEVSTEQSEKEIQE